MIWCVSLRLVILRIFWDMVFRMMMMVGVEVMSILLLSIVRVLDCVMMWWIVLLCFEIFIVLI